MLALHTITTKPWTISECIENYARAGITGISIWRDVVAGQDHQKIRQQLNDAGLTPISYVRGGFFTGLTNEARQAAITENLTLLQEASQLGLPSLVLVCGATPGQSPLINRAQIRDGIAALLQYANDLGIDLLIEPLHPIYAADRSAISTLKAANDLCAELDHPRLKIAIDVYHLWWDHQLEAELARCAKNNWLAAYHISDFKPDQSDPLNDRGIMGEGCINLKEIDHWIRDDHGFSGYTEVEIFSTQYWQENPQEFLKKITTAYQKIYQP